MRQGPIENVVIVGGGTAGWMAATGLAKLIGPQLKITLIESDEIGIVGVGEATIPAIKLFNQAVGLDENAFLKATHGTFKLGIEFVDWFAPGARYIHAFGDIGPRVGLIDFYHYWLRAQAAGQGGLLWDYSPNAAAAAEAKFARMPRLADTPMAGLAYAFHFDAGLYARFLRTIAQSAGVERIEGKITRTLLREPDGFVRAVQMESGVEIAGDLFIDCSGFRGLLIEEALHTGYDDWRAFLPCDRALAVPSARTEPLLPFTRSTAKAAGWQWRIPLTHRTGNGYVYCSDFVSDDEAAASLLAGLDGEALADPRPLRFVTGRRKKFWNKNVVALGLASGFMEPLESTSIHLIQSGLIRLATMFPDKAFAPALVDEYNRLSGIEFERIRDFIQLHYKANARHDHPFWDMCRALPASEGLARKLSVFQQTGRIHREQDELFTEAGWLQVMIGQGVHPVAYHPLADALSADQLAGMLADIKIVIGREIGRLPTQAAFIAKTIG
ncbi:MAG: tryptophan halogenase family protein [Caulobacterales bacterium]|jgi:tryptophan halogenase